MAAWPVYKCAMRWSVTIGCCCLLACTTGHASPGSVSPQGSETAQLAGDGVEAEAKALAAVRGVHGGAGPWVVAGYRMGRYALAALGLPRGSFDVEVIHHSPREVQYACIADGAAAATGASLGRLNLSLEPAEAARTRTTFRNRRTGATVTLQATAGFARRYLDVPRAELAAAGAEVLRLPDAAIFRVLADGQTQAPTLAADGAGAHALGPAQRDGPLDVEGSAARP